MAVYIFDDFIGTTLESFNPINDTLFFNNSYTAVNLVLSQTNEGISISYSNQSILLSGINISSLKGTELTFEDGSLFLLGTALGDVLTGSAFSDQIDISAGGSDNVAGGDGNDFIIVGSGLNSGDVIDGGAGTADELRLSGNYVTRVDLTSTTVTGVENIIFGPGGGVWLRLHDNLFATANGSVTFNATS